MILILIPTLNRPGKLRALAENARDATRAPTRVLFVVEAEDAASRMAVAVLQSEGLAALVVNDRKPCYAGAINAGYATAVSDGTPFTHFFLGADDIVFRSGWDAPALAVLESSPDLQVAGTNDLRDPMVIAGMIASHYLVDRRYADDTGCVIDGPPGIVLCEAYLHGSACAEFHETACARGHWSSCLDSIVEHHPGTDGKTYEPGLGQSDLSVFNTRRPLWDNWRSRSYLAV